ncbi:MAG: LysE/ArgO family amino acid transporter [Actinobacteria bacterium]|nr:amino acid transporter [Actinomycetota bacterium]MCA0307972.1 LysE/ArgO family amino acid transporter [Actinomycetota bacterium]
MLPTALSGLGFGLSLIVAIGAQNAFVMRQGLRREHVGVVVVICALSDIVLIALGTGGVGAVISAHRPVLAGVTVVGSAVLLWYAATAVRRAVRPVALVADFGGEAGRMVPVAVTALALTWLNPHVYLDTVVLLGSVASAQASPWTFAAGAMVASVAWFAGLGYGAQVLRPLFARPAAWRVFDLGVAAVMTTVAVGLLLGLRGDAG